MTDWTDANIEILRAGVAAGDSYSQIAKRIPRCTRNGAIGKAKRLGIAQPGAPSAPTRRPIAPKIAKAPRQNHGGLTVRLRNGGSTSPLKLAGNGAVFAEPEAPRPPRVVIPFRQEGPGLATPMTLQAHQCKWPIGDPGDEDFTHCGLHAPDGPYCASHAAVAYQPAQARKASAHELARALRRYI